MAESPEHQEERQQSARVARLEESQMFVDRRVDDLSEQVIAVEQSLRDAQTRLRRLEESIARLLSPPDDDIPE